MATYDKQERINYQEMSFGDVININAPYEENTPEYYNGYNPLEVRGKYITDSKGYRSKWRPVMVIDVTETELIYIPLTTSTGSEHDPLYQYHVKDNSMTPTNPNRPNLETFAEIGSIRRIPIKSHYTALKYGTLTDEDQENIKTLLDKDGLNVHDGIDRYKYLLDENLNKLRTALEYKDYERIVTMDSIIYIQDNREFTIYNSGVVHYHFDLPIEVIRRKIEAKEHITINDDDIAEALSNAMLELQGEEL